ncbi:MAG: TonB-dependent siderophore receptor [Luteibacter sp.]|uniref:TonB-dependent siderophore receptor n=1 Tax=Luteibacter sp. TaxID=1886636 RepID=UPI002806C22E|nr:TonB-dependent siderophore receptor [Luteibacter sp.]MDQ7994507.1 TonB-dependent siderophore receptor [Luteibacter sp.]MDQ8048106.1 TonB-dependent siderophore receptor [Luteibacter sp.]
MTLARTPLALALLALAPLAQASDDRAAPQQARTLPTIDVHASATDGYHAADSQLDTFGSFGSAALHDTPAAITVITRAQIDDCQPRTLSELVRGDAAINDNYAPAGYYQDVSIRGFPLDLATGFRFNGMMMSAEQLQALEGKERVEVLKGLGGLEAGVVEPGGLVNYVSKRPAEVHNVTLGTDSHGSSYEALDVGTWFTPSFGVRVNAANEKTHGAIEHTDGRRSFLSIGADWKINEQATLLLDTDYQTSGGNSASGYQLLGGTSIPAHPSRTRLLGYQPWQRPVGIHSSNTSLRFNYRFSDTWNAQVSAGHSHTVIDDNVAFAYGCFYAEACASGATPGYFFAPNGDYDVYDYRSPDDTRQNDEVRGVVTGSFATGALDHEINLGASAFRRTVDQRPYVYDYVGTANIDDRVVPVFDPSPNQPGVSVRRLTSWQRTLFAIDRIHMGEQWQVLAGARLVKLDERAYDDTGALERDTRETKTLPQAAVLWQPTAPLTTYLSYGEGISLGREAPYWTSNGGTTLAPLHSRQVEAGVKYAVSDVLDLQAALYRIRQSYQFARPDDTAEGFTFVQQGQEVHTGIELNLAGQVTDRLRITASANAIRARAENTGAPSYEDHQVVNVPRWRTAVYADYSLPFVQGLAVLGGWRYASSNVATPDGATRVPGYHVFDAGLRYATTVSGHAMTWRLNVDNVFNHFYWRDTGTSGGDAYLFPGMPRLARLSVTYDL